MWQRARSRPPCGPFHRLRTDYSVPNAFCERYFDLSHQPFYQMTLQSSPVSLRDSSPLPLAQGIRGYLIATSQRTQITQNGYVLHYIKHKEATTPPYTRGPTKGRVMRGSLCISPYAIEPAPTALKSAIKIKNASRPPHLTHSPAALRNCKTYTSNADYKNSH